MKKKGKYLFVIENVFYSKEKFVEFLEIDESTFIELSMHNCIFFEKTSVSFSFVGLISVNNTLVCVFPKYYKHQTESLAVNDFVKVLKVLKKAQKTDKIAHSFKNYNTKSSISSDLIIADVLIKDYLDHGIYIKEFEAVQLNGNGEVSWDETIAYLDPIISNGRPFYSDTYNYTSISETTFIITEIHKVVLDKLNKLYGEILGFGAMNVDTLIKDLTKLGSVEYLTTIINKELSQIYSDRKIRLLKSILSFLNKGFEGDDNGIDLYGTSSYHTIWEKVLNDAINLNKDSVSIPHPFWHNLTGKSQFKKTWIPDIVFNLTSDKNYLFILDAKYYNLSFTEDPVFIVEGNPGIEDIAKQYFYELALNNQVFDEVLNILMFPKLGTEGIELVGFITLEVFPDKQIWITYADPDYFYNFYIRNQKVPIMVLQDLIKQIKISLLENTSNSSMKILES